MTHVHDIGGSSWPSSVLVVDDDAAIRTVFGRLLPAQGLPVVVEASGEDAIERLLREGFGCLLVDKNLPGVSGIEVIRRARQQQPHCACIVMTAYASTNSAVEAMRLGAIDYLEKPFHDLDLVAHKVSQAIVHQRALHEAAELAARVRKLKDQAHEQNATIAQQKTELELFDRLVEVRIQQASEELRVRCAHAEASAAEGHSIRKALCGRLEDLHGFAEQARQRVGDNPGAAAPLMEQLSNELERIKRALAATLHEPTG